MKKEYMKKNLKKKKNDSLELDKNQIIRRKKQGLSFDTRPYIIGVPKTLVKSFFGSSCSP